MSIWSSTGCFSTGWPRPYLMGSDRHDGEVVFRQLYLAVEDRDQVLASSFCGFASGPWHSRQSVLILDARSSFGLSPPCGSWQVTHPCPNAGWCGASSVCCSAWSRGKPGKFSPDRAAESRRLAGVRDCGRSMHSPCAPGCCTFAVSICSALVVVAGEAERFASVCVSTTLPSSGARGRYRRNLVANGACVNFCISFGLARLVRIVALHAVGLVERLSLCAL